MFKCTSAHEYSGDTCLHKVYNQYGKFIATEDYCSFDEYCNSLDEDMEWIPVVVWYNYEHNKWVTYGDKCPPTQLWTYLPEPPNRGL